MRSLDIRHIAAVGALALLVAAPLAACGADSLTPLPVQAAGAEPSASTNLTSAAAPSGSAGSGSSPPSVVRPPVVAKPTKTKSTKPRPTPSTSTASTCFGAVRYDLDLQNTVLDLQKTMCFHTGGVLRLQGIGPGEVTATPATVVSDSYAAGVVDLRFIRPGTATVTIPQDGQTHTITVVVRS